MKKYLMLLLFVGIISSSVFASTNMVPAPMMAGMAAKKTLSKDELIFNFAKDHVLYFFYEMDCPYCREFAPVFKKFVDKYNFKVIAITDDGEAFPEFPNTKKDDGESSRFHPSGRPVVFAVNTNTSKHFLLFDGDISESQLKTEVLHAIRSGY